MEGLAIMVEGVRGLEWRYAGSKRDGSMTAVSIELTLDDLSSPSLMVDYWMESKISGDIPKRSVELHARNKKHLITQASSLGLGLDMNITDS